MKKKLPTDIQIGGSHYRAPDPTLQPLFFAELNGFSPSAAFALKYLCRLGKKESSHEKISEDLNKAAHALCIYLEAGGREYNLHPPEEATEYIREFSEYHNIPIVLINYLKMDQVENAVREITSLIKERGKRIEYDYSKLIENVRESRAG